MRLVRGAAPDLTHKYLQCWFRLCTQVVSARFPSPMCLAFERAAQPLLLLQVNK